MTEEADRPRVAVSDRQDRPVDPAALVGLARVALRGEGVVNAELSVSLVTSEEMAQLHQRYMREPGPTDVLSFPQDESESQNGRSRLLGDVVICPDVAAEQNPDLQAELRLLVVHGILHLLGYDHRDEEEQRRMWERQDTYAGARP